MSLDKYQQKRDFNKTAEPRGAFSSDVEGRKYLIQKHAARSLHYDFRLQVGGALKSWAVPKGPSLNPKVKRLAVETEDHPLEYGEFEGTIPPDNYGAGTVMLWDTGEWEPIARAEKALTAGKLEFELHGERLQGRWVLVRMKGGGRTGKEWLLIKEEDEYAVDDVDPTEEFTSSVITARSMDDIAGAETQATKQQPKASSASTKTKTKTKNAEKAIAVDPGKVAGVALSNPDKVLYDEMGITKQSLAEYYAAVSEWMLPYVKGRPLTLVRCPQGSERHCFYQKHLGDAFDDAVHPVEIEEKNCKSTYAYVDSVAGLIGLVQMGTLEIHSWGSRIDELEKPDNLVFDLDPDQGVSWNQVKQAAGELRYLLQELGLESFLRASGGKGLHLVVPVMRRRDWEETKLFCKAVAEHMTREYPDRYVATMSKAKRKNKIFIDYLRNSRGATSICNYSTRSKPCAPVATPLGWHELEQLESAQVYRVDNLLSRLETIGDDPWESYHGLRQSITEKAIRQLTLH